MRLIHIVAALMVVLAGAIYGIGRRDPVLRLCAKWLVIFALLFGALPFMWGCEWNPPTSPSCKWVTQERIEAKWLQEINGRTFYVVAYAPKTEIEVCE